MNSAVADELELTPTCSSEVEDDTSLTTGSEGDDGKDVVEVAAAEMTVMLVITLELSMEVICGTDPAVAVEE